MKDFEEYIKKFEELMPQFHKVICGTEECGLEEMSLTPHQFIVLKSIRDLGKCNMSELSVSLGVTMGNTTGLVDRLIKEGYVAREHDPGDRRIVIVKLTGKGKKITEKIIERKSSMLLKIFSSSS